MTDYSPKPKKRKNSARADAIKSPHIYIDPANFHLMRHRAFLTIQQAAKLLDVTQRTLQNWENGRVPISPTLLIVF